MNISPDVGRVVEAALLEDRAWEDVTTALVVPPGARATAEAIVKREAVIAGLECFAAAFHVVDPSVRVDLLAADGDRVQPGQAVARVAGSAASMLAAERVALNFLQRLSGIATLTRRCVDAVADLPNPPRISDTRKTTPGLRALEKAAVRAGGGHNHRMTLADGILIKDNHLAVARAAGLTLADAVARARAGAPHLLRVAVEVTTLAEVDEAVAAGADVILLDNMDAATMAEAVRRVAGRAATEASGGVNLANVRGVAEAGVDVISVGTITHSVPAVDISLEFNRFPPRNAG